MKICFFSKYPPTEGGVSSRTYWLARALGERGVEVHIVTNALEEGFWRERIDFENPDDLANYQPANVYIHSLDSSSPGLKGSKDFLIGWNYEARLASLGIGIIEHYQCDVIDSHYLLPNGVAAYLAKKITNRPLILRHAGSDIAKITHDNTLHHLFRKIFLEADLIFTHREKNDFFKKIGIPLDKLFFGFNYGLDPKYFNPHVPPADLSAYGVQVDSDLPIITYVGKLYQKGLHELIEAASQIKEDFLLLFVVDGWGLNEFKEYVSGFPSLKKKCHFLGFVPPWRIPSILKTSTCLVELENNFPFLSHAPMPPLEAMRVGTCSLVSQEVYRTYKCFKNSERLENGKNIFVTEPTNNKELKESLQKIIRNKGLVQEMGKEALNVFNQEDFSVSISAMEKIYEKLCHKGVSLRVILEELKEVIIKHLNNI